MNNIKRCKLWLTVGIVFFLISVGSFIDKLYIDSVIKLLLSISFLGLALASSNIKDDTKNAINKFVAYIIHPIIITFIGTFFFVGIEDTFYKSKDVNISLCSINFFIIIFIINIFFKKNNISFKKHL
ncbi:hypothetical protein [Clostridium uliginosum]|uniref:Uncharacterized protein n=1 Tax=Clostridium uliginosum TaxID=119641 RepID=A0A1I1NQK8_9CLOT|nr:hypothetical protein [Clostridium uliginosum]SFC99954.1 hypothetical protein SAMN05421842_11648 [Clostridium uliginosum]